MSTNPTFLIQQQAQRIHDLELSLLQAQQQARQSKQQHDAAIATLHNQHHQALRNAQRQFDQELKQANKQLQEEKHNCEKKLIMMETNLVHSRAFRHDTMENQSTTSTISLVDAEHFQNTWEKRHANISQEYSASVDKMKRNHAIMDTEMKRLKSQVQEYSQRMIALEKYQVELNQQNSYLNAEISQLQVQHEQTIVEHKKQWQQYTSIMDEKHATTTQDKNTHVQQLEKQLLTSQTETNKYKQKCSKLHHLLQEAQAKFLHQIQHHVQLQKRQRECTQNMKLLGQELIQRQEQMELELRQSKSALQEQLVQSNEKWQRTVTQQQQVLQRQMDQVKHDSAQAKQKQVTMMIRDLAASSPTRRNSLGMRRSMLSPAK